MRKSIALSVLVAMCAVFSSWSAGGSEPKPPASSTPATPYVKYEIPYISVQNSVSPFGVVCVTVRTNVKVWSDGRREFSGSPSFQINAFPIAPYYIVLPVVEPWGVTKVLANTKYAIIVFGTRSFQRIIQIDPVTGYDIWTLRGYPMIYTQAFQYCYYP